MSEQANQRSGGWAGGAPGGPMVHRIIGPLALVLAAIALALEAGAIVLLGAHLRDEVDLSRVSEGLLVAVHSTVRPEAASVWLRGRRA